MPRERGLWLIDGSYLYKAQPPSRDFQLDYRKLKEVLSVDGEIWRSYYLNSSSSNVSAEQEGFFRWMQTAPPVGPKIIVKNYPIRRFPLDNGWCDTCGKKIDVSCGECKSKLYKEQQKGVDVGIATLALSLMGSYDSLLLSSGDSDLLDAVEFLCQQGKKFEMVVFRNGTAPELQSRADRIYWIDDFLDTVNRRKVEDRKGEDKSA